MSKICDTKHPLLFVLWACLKLGTAYRLAAGADFPHKLMGLGQTVGPAFANLAPGLDPLTGLLALWARWLPAADLLQEQERKEIPAG